MNAPAVHFARRRRKKRRGPLLPKGRASTRLFMGTKLYNPFGAGERSLPHREKGEGSKGCDCGLKPRARLPRKKKRKKKKGGKAGTLHPRE